MAIAQDRQQDEYITLVRGLASQLWDTMIRLRALQAQWNALDYSNTLLNFTGNNEGLVAADIGAAVFATADELKLRILDTGHATNLSKLL